MKGSSNSFLDLLYSTFQAIYRGISLLFNVKMMAQKLAEGRPTQGFVNSDSTGLGIKKESE
jgi:hypothetical protein